MQAVILAAGMGSRLGKYTRSSTKCMVSVDGVTLLERIFDSLRRIGISRVVIVTGYQADALVAFAKEKGRDLDLSFVNNPDYSVTNNIFSLYLASDEMKKDDTLLFESDLIFDPEIVKKIAECPYPDVVAVSKFENWMDGTVTTFDKDGTVTAFIDKSSFSWDDTGLYFKTINIYKLSRNFFTKWYYPFLSAYIQACGYNAYYEMVLKVIANISGSELKALDISGYSWYEIDTPQDLMTAQTIFGRNKLDDLSTRYGGYWRFNEMKDYCYLVNPYFPPEKLNNEIKYSFGTLISQYPSGRRVTDSISASLFEVDEKNILTGNGAAELIKVLMNDLTGRFYITYPSFNEYPNAAENDFETADSSETDFRYDADFILSHMKDSENVIVINPDNPSGNFIPKEDMFRLLDRCLAEKRRIIVDESFMDFADPDKYYTLINDEILEKYPCLTVIKSISKSYGVPGLRLGVMASADRELMKRAAKALPIWNTNSFAEFFLQICGKYMKEYRSSCSRIAAERSRFSQKLAETGKLTVYPSQANFIMCRLTQGTAAGLAEYMISRNCLVKVLKGKAGCENGEYLRFAVRTEEENDELAELIGEFIPQTGAEI